MFRTVPNVSKMSATLVEPEDIIPHLRFMRGTIMSLGEGSRSDYSSKFNATKVVATTLERL